MEYHSISPPPPGGQACLAVPLGDSFVYPDMVAVKHTSIAIFENKGRFNKDDVEKLKKLKRDRAARAIIYSHIKEANKNISLINFFISFR